MDNNPTWTKKPYISLGYREQNKSCLNYLASIFKIHNESVNIWTHMMGLLYFLL